MNASLVMLFDEIYSVIICKWTVGEFLMRNVLKLESVERSVVKSVGKEVSFD